MRSNLSSQLLMEWLGVHVCYVDYRQCSVSNLKEVYGGELVYEKDGLQFVHRESTYTHGFNPNVLVWRDLATSKGFEMEIAENAEKSSGVGYVLESG